MRPTALLLLFSLTACTRLHPPAWDTVAGDSYTVFLQHAGDSYPWVHRFQRQPDGSLQYADSFRTVNWEAHYVRSSR